MCCGNAVAREVERTLGAATSSEACEEAEEEERGLIDSISSTPLSKVGVSVLMVLGGLLWDNLS